MRKYRVAFFYTVYGSTDVEAKSKQAAQAKVNDSLSEDGLDTLKFRTNEREFDAQDVEFIATLEDPRCPANK